ncbi:MAG: flippase-like domain-containing protein [Acidobacteriia bacterium]|nr:flippase-like domain-containing protein [Terriglobia bacterium]
MNKKQFIISALVLALLLALVYLQVRTWRKFDWLSFAAATKNIHWHWIFVGVALIYGDYLLRAMRWKVLLRPVKQTTSFRLLPPTMIGFTGLALFGRPGELIRPYLIARKEGLTMSSQMAVWLVERIFDMGAFAMIMAVSILVSADNLHKLDESHHTRYFLTFELAGSLLLSVVVAMTLFAFRIRRDPAAAAITIERILAPFSPRVARAIAQRVHTFGEGLHTIANLKSFLQLASLSVVIWLVIGITYLIVTHAFPQLSDMTLPSVLLLTAGSVVGGVLQLPVVGGGSQLATISILIAVFGVEAGVATSCGIMLWLVTFMSVVPGGLFLAHREHVSLTKVEEESIEEEEKFEEIG